MDHLTLLSSVITLRNVCESVPVNHGSRHRTQNRALVWHRLAGSVATAP